MVRFWGKSRTRVSKGGGEDTEFWESHYPRNLGLLLANQYVTRFQKEELESTIKPLMISKEQNKALLIQWSMSYYKGSDSLFDLNFKTQMKEKLK